MVSGINMRRRADLRFFADRHFHGIEDDAVEVQKGACTEPNIEAVVAEKRRADDCPFADKANAFHHKTRKRVWKLLDATLRGDSSNRKVRRLYPELDDAIAKLPRLGVPLVLFRPQRGPKDESGQRVPRLYSEAQAQHLVQKIRKLARLPAHFTLEACRHGGMTELGDAELTEQEIMTLSTHATPEAARLYVKRNERQELSAATKRRDFVEGKRTKRG